MFSFLRYVDNIRLKFLISLQKPIVDRLGEAYDNPAKVSTHLPQPNKTPKGKKPTQKCSFLIGRFHHYMFPFVLQTELALQLCWAIGEHGGGGPSHKDEARELFESLELLLYENLSSRYNITVP